MTLFTLAHCNACCLRSKFYQVQHLVNLVWPSIIWITETNLNQEIQSSEATIHVYMLVRRDQDRTDGAKYGRRGVVVYLQSHISCSCLNIPYSAGKAVMWARGILPNKSMIVGTMCNAPAFHITGYREASLDNIRDKISTLIKAKTDHLVLTSSLKITPTSLR